MSHETAPSTGQPPSFPRPRLTCTWESSGGQRVTERVTPQLRAHPDVLDVRWHMFAHAKKWEPCVDNRLKPLFHVNAKVFYTA
jgi:hypothetical protein